MAAGPITPADFRATRRKLGLSAAKIAGILRVSGGRTVRRWESGARPIRGPVSALMFLLARRPGLVRELRR